MIPQATEFEQDFASDEFAEEGELSSDDESEDY
jgi:hypothetical protein